MERQCQLAEVSRAGLDCYLQQTLPEQADLLLRARLQELAVAHHRLRGYRMSTELLRREGQEVNHKRVLRLMREDNLLKSATDEVCVYDGFAAQSADLSEPGAACEFNEAQPVVGGGHYFHSATQRVRLSGGGFGCVLTARDRLGSGTHVAG